MMRFSALLALMLFLSGCVGSPAWETISHIGASSDASRNNKNMLKLYIGQSRTDALRIMGAPERREAYQIGSQRVIDFYIYRTAAEAYTRDDDRLFTPIAFENNQLAGWGRNYYNNVVRSAVELTIKRR